MNFMSKIAISIFSLTLLISFAPAQGMEGDWTEQQLKQEATAARAKRAVITKYEQNRLNEEISKQFERVDELNRYSNSMDKSYDLAASAYRIKNCLDQGASSNSVRRRSPFLMNAVTLNLMPIIRLLLAYDADTNVKNTYGYAPLDSGVDSPEICAALLKAGAQVTGEISEPAQPILEKLSREYEQAHNQTMNTERALLSKHIPIAPLRAIIVGYMQQTFEEAMKIEAERRTNLRVQEEAQDKDEHKSESTEASEKSTPKNNDLD